VRVGSGRGRGAVRREECKITKMWGGGALGRSVDLRGQLGEARIGPSQIYPKRVLLLNI